MNVIIMGPPGAGKGTQSELIKQKYSIPVIATGDMFREAVKIGSTLGIEAKKFMEDGKLVPDEVTIGIVKERIAQSDCDEGFMLDGFPRTTPQAEALDAVLQSMGKKLEAAINIFVPREILLERILGRVSCKDCKTVFNLKFNLSQNGNVCDRCGGELIQRNDDRGETAVKRLEVYLEQTMPLLEYYENKNLLFNMDGNRSSEEVFSDIKKILENFR